MLKDISVNKAGDLVLVVGTNGNSVDALPLSKSGKTKVVSTTGGFTNCSIKEFGMVGVNLNITAGK